MANWYDSLGEVDWGGAVKQAIPAAIGTYVAGQANERAANTLAGANRFAAEQMAAGSAGAQRRYDEMAERTAPAVSYLRNVVSDTGLTPGQQQRVADTRRLTGQQLSSKLGGRSATAIATRAAQDLENNVYGANRARSDQAAYTLAGQNTGALNASASNEQALGTNLGNVAIRGGENTANAELASGRLQGEMLGSVMSPIRSVIAEERKGAYPTPSYGSK